MLTKYYLGYPLYLVYKPGKTISNPGGLSALPQPIIPKDEEVPIKTILLTALKKSLFKVSYITRYIVHVPILSRVTNRVWRIWPDENPSKEFDPFFLKEIRTAHS